MEINLRVKTEREFDGACDDIADAWWRSERTRKDVLWLEQVTYELIGHILDEQLEEVWEFRETRLGKKGRPGRDNPFMLGLRLIFVGRSEKFDPKLRERIALRLRHAYRHIVPAPFLRTFLGPVSRRPAFDEILPGFKAWVAYMLRWSETDHFSRGAYSEELRNQRISRSEFPILAGLRRKSKPKRRKGKKRQRAGNWDADV